MDEEKMSNNFNEKKEKLLAYNKMLNLPINNFVNTTGTTGDTKSNKISNLILTRQNQNHFEEIIRKVKRNNSNSGNTSKIHSNDHQTDYEICTSNKQIIIIIFGLILIICFMIIIIILLRNKYNFGESEKIDFKLYTVSNLNKASPKLSTTVRDFVVANATSTESYTKLIQSNVTEAQILINKEWFISRKQWKAVFPKWCPTKRNKYTNIVVLKYSLSPCRSYFCKRSIQEEQRAYQNIYRCDDVDFHYGISEDGEIYEGRSTQCQTVPAYRRMFNETFLLINAYLGMETLVCSNEKQIRWQIRAINEIVVFNQNVGVLSNVSLSLITENKYCAKIYMERLNQTFTDVQSINEIGSYPDCY